MESSSRAPRASSVSNNKGKEQFGLSIPKYAPSSSAAASTSTRPGPALPPTMTNIMRHMEHQKHSLAPKRRAPMHPQDRNVRTSPATSAAPKTHTPPSKPPTSTSASANTARQSLNSRQAPPHAQQFQQAPARQLQQPAPAREQQQQPQSRKIHLVTDSEIPDRIVDKEHGRDYAKLEFLGEGGFARCYKVRDDQKKLFAVKVVSKQSLWNRKYLTKMHAEILIHGRMQHDHVVQFYNCFEDDRNIYLIIELCSNKSLAEMLKMRRRLTEPEVRFFMIQLLDACDYIHSQQVVHRDIKLSNVFLDENMNVKLGDFGLSAILKTPEDRKKTVCGTPSYLAPEIVFGKDGHNQKVDVWSLGILMYTLLIGRHPFKIRTSKDFFKPENKERTLTFPDTPALSKDAVDLVSKMLVADPDERLSIPEILHHSFIQHAELPTMIPCSAFEKQPSLSDLRPVTHFFSGTDRKLVERVALALARGLDRISLHKKTLKGTPIDPPTWTPANVYINKWIDFTSRYGMGYNTSDGTHAVLFNDATTLMTYDRQAYQFITHGTDTTIEEHDINSTDLSRIMKKRSSLLDKFIEYMREKLTSLIDFGHDSPSGVYLAKYMVLDRAIVFRLSNDVIQFNFFGPRFKLILFDDGSKLIFVGEDKVTHMYELAEAIASGNEDILACLAFARDELLQQHKKIFRRHRQPAKMPTNAP
ncbi:kinase-like domain-containing protein [Gongronella butleri]|nr:kinase-like domain-containing protein [Gongronella butleri]